MSFFIATFFLMQSIIISFFRPDGRESGIGYITLIILLILFGVEFIDGYKKGMLMRKVLISTISILLSMAYLIPLISHIN